MVGMLLAMAIYAARPTPSEAFTVKRSYNNGRSGSIVRSTTIPFGSQIFEDEEEVLASITTNSDSYDLCSIRLTGMDRNNNEEVYQYWEECPTHYGETSEKKREYLENDPPVEFRGSAAFSTRGFKIKHDSGNINVWGVYDTERQTEWAVLSGPIIGFHFFAYPNDLTLVVGDRCRPKYFGARKL